MDPEASRIGASMDKTHAMQDVTTEIIRRNGAGAQTNALVMLVKVEWKAVVSACE